MKNDTTIINKARQLHRRSNHYGSSQCWQVDKVVIREAIVASNLACLNSSEKVTATLFIEDDVFFLANRTTSCWASHVVQDTMSSIHYSAKWMHSCIAEIHCNWLIRCSLCPECIS